MAAAGKGGPAPPAGSSAPVAAADAKAGFLIVNTYIYTRAVGEARWVKTGPD